MCIYARSTYSALEDKPARGKSAAPRQAFSSRLGPSERLFLEQSVAVQFLDKNVQVPRGGILADAVLGQQHVEQLLACDGQGDILKQYTDWG
jgi:hypothetical protein